MRPSLTINVLHLSDLHFGYGEDATASAQRALALEGLVRELGGLESEWRPQILVISGDLTWQGKPAGYTKLGEWLTLHPGKSRIYRCADGVTFLGWRLFGGRARLVRGNVIRFARRMKQFERDFAAGSVTWENVEQSVRAWIAHASFGNTWVLRERLLGRFAFNRGARPLRAGGVLQQLSEEPPRCHP